MPTIRRSYREYLVEVSSSGRKPQTFGVLAESPAAAKQTALVFAASRSTRARYTATARLVPAVKTHKRPVRQQRPAQPLELLWNGVITPLPLDFGKMLKAARLIQWCRECHLYHPAGDLVRDRFESGELIDELWNAYDNLPFGD